MSKEMMSLDMVCPLDSVDAYIYRANQLPYLTEAEELEYAKQYYDNNDLEAAKKLIVSHLRFVVRVARDYSGYGLAIGDLIQEGNVGLMKAVKRFNPYIGVRLVSFAVHWVKSEMHEFIMRNWRVVKVATTKAQRKCFFNLRKMKKRLGWFTHQEVQQVAEDLGVTTKDVLAMEQRLNAMDIAYDTSSQDDDAHQYFSPANTLTANNSDPSLITQQADSDKFASDALQDALAQLDDRSRDIVMMRWLTDKKTTLQELASKYNVSAERIRQLEQRALKLLKQNLA